jgi:hypothetical protein
MKPELDEDEEYLPLSLKDFHCTKCAFSKFTKQVSKTIKRHAKQPLERMYSDLSGKFSTRTKEEAQYYISLIDERIRYV